VQFYVENGRFAFLSTMFILIGKRVVDFLLVLNELFSPGVTAEALRGNSNWKSAFSLQPGQFDPQFQVEGGVAH